MERREFLEKLSIGAAFVLTASCLQSCKKDNTATVDFTLNIDAPENAALKVNGGFVIVNGVVIAKDNTGNFLAATQTCSHEGNKGISYNKTSNEFVCSVHGARFDTKGKGLNENGNKGLTIYQTTLSGSTLRVFS
jgi:nitrite reductase/ring-hydroxylating ferredoxin subunit